jgi:signal transduction histidine kinase
MTTPQSFTIFIVDDIPANLGVLDEFLTEQGFEVLMASDGESAINKIEKAQPHLILLDVLMPNGIDGFETCQRLKANPRTKEIPIIFMTALTDIVDKVKGFKLGAVDYITKPFQQEEVLARIKTHLRIHQLQQQSHTQNEELRLANAKLARAARMKDEFLANMSHELRTPLVAILGMSEALLEETYGEINIAQQKSIRTIQESGKHLLSLINEILDLAKIESGKLKLEKTKVSVTEVSQTCLRLIKELAQKKRIKIKTIFDQDVITLNADERYLKQILINLLSNAVKFTPEKGIVTLAITGDVKEKLVQFSVSDTGIGIAEEDKEKLFEPFVQLDAELNRHHEGTGLGLSLVDRLTKMHGGSITLKSEIGKGSCFTVSLPWQPTTAQETTSETVSDFEQESNFESKKKLPQSSPEKTLILLADDNLTTCETVSEYLTAKGYRLILAHNGLQAIEETLEKRPNIILMDVQMPTLDGLDAMRRIRSHPKIAQTPIIALTALAMAGDEARCLQAGANDYLSKPFSFKGLVKKIEALLQIPIK